MRDYMKSSDFIQQIVDDRYNRVGDAVSWREILPSHEEYSTVIDAFNTPILDVYQYDYMRTRNSVHRSMKDRWNDARSTVVTSAAISVPSSGVAFLSSNTYVDLVALVGAVIPSAIAGIMLGDSLMKTSENAHIERVQNSAYLVVSSSYADAETESGVYQKDAIVTERDIFSDVHVCHDPHTRHLVDDELFYLLKNTLSSRKDDLDPIFRETLFKRLGAYIRASLKLQEYRDARGKDDYVLSKEEELKKVRASIVDYLEEHVNLALEESRHEIDEEILNAC